MGLRCNRRAFGEEEAIADLVLVHGSFGGGWMWKRLAPLLQAAGHRVYCPTLTGLGDRSHLLSRAADLNTHIKDVANLLFYEDIRGAVLVGHSYSGMVITGVAQTVPERVGQLIYLDAYVPQPGQSRWDLLPPEVVAAERAAVDADGGTGPPPPASMMVPIDPDTAAWVDARLSPRHPVGTYEQPIPADGSALGPLPRAFIQCMLGPSRFAPFAAQARASGWAVRELAAGHLAPLTHPREVANFLLELVAGELSVVSALQLEANEAVMRRFLEEFQSAHDLEVLDEILAPDFVNRTRPSAPDRAGLKEVARLLFAAFPDLRVTTYEMIAEGDLVAVRKALEGTHQGEFLGVAPTGKQVTFSVIDVSRFRDGRIVEHWSEGTVEAEVLQKLRDVPAKELSRT